MASIGQHTIKPTSGAVRRRKRVGRGNGSGHGTFSTRGCKGQKSRTGKKLRAGFEGGQTPLIKRMPKLPGFKNYNHISYQVINLNKLSKHFKDGEEVSAVELKSKGLIANAKDPVKVLGTGEMTAKLKITLNAASKSAVSAIEKAGGTINLTGVITPKTIAAAKKEAAGKSTTKKGKATKATVAKAKKKEAPAEKTQEDTSAEASTEEKA